MVTDKNAPAAAVANADELAWVLDDIPQGMSYRITAPTNDGREALVTRADVRGDQAWAVRVPMGYAGTITYVYPRIKEVLSYLRGYFDI